MTDMADDRTFPGFRAIAEHGLLVEFGDSIDARINDLVLRLDKALADRPFPGLRETVPAYAALLIRFDPLLCDHAEAERAVRGLIGQGAPRSAKPATHEVLVCYDGHLAPDLAAVAQAAGISPEQVIEAHLSGEYDVFMYGFAPGYAYLAGVPSAIRLPRKASAVRGVATGSVIVAGPQCLVTTITMPTGWWVIGRSPTPILTGDKARPFLFDVGDRVRFRRIDRAAYEAGAAT